MEILTKKAGIAAIGLCVMVLVTALYFPGLNGPWLVDDDWNLSHFLHYTAADAPYHDLIFGNNSGPLGRSVSMGSFAINHALNLFSTPALKATNLFFHLCNGLLIYVLFLKLFRLKNPISSATPSMLASLLAIWWLVLPLHTSTVLYIVQRMTQVATLFSLLTCLAWVIGRSWLSPPSSGKKTPSSLTNDTSNRPLNSTSKIGWVWIFASLFVFFPLALFAKESAISTLAWLVLIELFFFVPATPKRKWLSRQTLLTSIILLVTILLILFSLSPYITNGYIGREFTFTERLLTEPRILWAYISDIFLPNNQYMGLFHDDFPISRSLLYPWTTLAAIVGVIGLLILSIKLSATKWWAVSFGILLYFSGHLAESTVVALELYFEHRNYLPSIGLLLAATAAIANFWPGHKRWLLLAFVLYVATLSFSTLQRSHIWGDNNLLLETSALNHPHSLRAWSDYTENLLSTKGGKAALEAALAGGKNNPEFASISWLHMVSIYCRLDEPPPPNLLALAGNTLPTTPHYYTTPLSVGLQNILENQQADKCGKADLSPLVQSLPALDTQLRQYYGNYYSGYWLLRFTMAGLLLQNHEGVQAITWLREIWQTTNHADIPTVGLTFAKALAEDGNITEMSKVLSELDTVTADAPSDFLEEMKQLREQGKIPPSHP